MKFKEYYQSLPTPRDKQRFRNEVIQVCFIQFSTFYSWLYRGKVPLHAQQSISKLINRPQAELFPVEN